MEGVGGRSREALSLPGDPGASQRRVRCIWKDPLHRVCTDPPRAAVAPSQPQATHWVGLLPPRTPPPPPVTEGGTGNTVLVPVEASTPRTREEEVGDSADTGVPSEEECGEDEVEEAGRFLARWEEENPLGEHHARVSDLIAEAMASSPGGWTRTEEEEDTAGNGHNVHRAGDKLKPGKEEDELIVRHHGFLSRFEEHTRVTQQHEKLETATREVNATLALIEESIDRHEQIYLYKDKLRLTFEALGFAVPREDEEEFFDQLLLQPAKAIEAAAALHHQRHNSPTKHTPNNEDQSERRASRGGTAAGAEEEKCCIS